MENELLEQDNTEGVYENTSGIIQNGLNKMLPKQRIGPNNDQIMEHFGL